MNAFFCTWIRSVDLVGEFFRISVLFIVGEIYGRFRVFSCTGRCALACLLSLPCLLQAATRMEIRLIDEKGNDIRYAADSYIQLDPDQRVDLAHIQGVRAEAGASFDILQHSTVTRGQAGFPAAAYITEIVHIETGENLVDVYGVDDGTGRKHIVMPGSYRTVTVTRSGRYRVTAHTVRQYIQFDYLDQYSPTIKDGDILSGDILLSQEQPIEGIVGRHGINGYLGGGFGIDNNGIFACLSAEVHEVFQAPVSGMTRRPGLYLRVRKRYEYHVANSTTTYVADGETDKVTLMLARSDLSRIQKVAGRTAQQVLDSNGDIDFGQLLACKADEFDYEESAKLNVVKAGAFAASEFVLGEAVTRASPYVNVIMDVASGDARKVAGGILVIASKKAILGGKAGAPGGGVGIAAGAVVSFVGSFITDGVIAEWDASKVREAFEPGIADDLYVSTEQTGTGLDNVTFHTVTVHNKGVELRNMRWSLLTTGGRIYDEASHINWCVTDGLLVRRHVPFHPNWRTKLRADVTLASGQKVGNLQLAFEDMHHTSPPGGIMLRQPVGGAGISIALDESASLPIFQWTFTESFPLHESSTFELVFADNSDFRSAVHINVSHYAESSTVAMTTLDESIWESDIASKLATGTGSPIYWKVIGTTSDDRKVHSGTGNFHLLMLRMHLEPVSVTGYEPVSCWFDVWSTRPFRDGNWAFRQSHMALAMDGFPANRTSDAEQPEQFVPGNYTRSLSSGTTLKLTVYDTEGLAVTASRDIAIVPILNNRWIRREEPNDFGLRALMFPFANESDWRRIGLPDAGTLLPSRYAVYRHWFDANPDQNDLFVQLASQDGCEIFVNGERLGHYGGTGRRKGSVNRENYIPNEVVNDIPIPRSMLRNGQNLIAAAVYNSEGASYFNLQLHPRPIPAESIPTPSNLNAEGGDRRVVLTWDAVDSDIVRYHLYRSYTPVGERTLIGTAPAGMTAVTDFTVINGRLYHYWVTAVGATGNESEFSTRASATPMESEPDPYYTPPNMLETYTEPLNPTGGDRAHVYAVLELADGGGSRGCRLKWWINQARWPWEQGYVGLKPVSGNRIWRTEDRLPPFATGTRVHYQLLPLSANGNGNWTETFSYVVGDTVIEPDPLADWDNDGYPACIDPDDNNPFVHPDAVEIPDGIDNNGDGRIDPFFDEPISRYRFDNGTVLNTLVEEDDDIVAVATADMNGDGFKEIVLVGYDWIYILDHELRTLAQREHRWRLNPDTRVYLRDMNANGTREIIVGCGTTLVALNFNASLTTMYTFPKNQSRGDFGIGDINGDGRLDVVYVDGDLVRAYRCTGSSFSLHFTYNWYNDLADYLENDSNWQYVAGGARGAKSLVVADIDADTSGGQKNGRCEIVFKFYFHSPRNTVPNHGHTCKLFDGIVLLNGNGNRLNVRYASGRSRRNSQRIYVWVCDEYDLLGVADVDNDGVMDILCHLKDDSVDGWDPFLEVYGPGLSRKRAYPFGSGLSVSHYLHDSKRGIAIRNNRNISVFSSDSNSPMFTFQSQNLGHCILGYDFNRDGVADFLLWREDYNHIEIRDGVSFNQQYIGTVRDRIARLDGNPTSLPAPHNYHHAIAVDDLDVNGLADLIVICRGSAVLYRQVREGVTLSCDGSGLAMFPPVNTEVAPVQTLVSSSNAEHIPVYFVSGAATDDGRTYTLRCRLADEDNVTQVPDSAGTWRIWNGTEYTAGASFSATGQLIRAYWTPRETPSAGLYNALCTVVDGDIEVTSASAAWGVVDSNLSMLFPISDTEISDLVEVRWSITNWVASPSISIYVRPAGQGDDWYPVVQGAFDSGRYWWDTISVPDGEYDFRMVATILGSEVASDGAEGIRIDNYFSDINNNNIPDGWEREHFGNLHTIKTTSDYDGDGFLDWQEYIAGTDPRDASCYFGVNHAKVDSADMRVAWQGVAGRRYRLFRSKSPHSVDWSDPVYSINCSEDGPLSFTDDVSGRQYYYRLVVDMLE